MDILNKKNGLN